MASLPPRRYSLSIPRFFPRTGGFLRTRTQAAEQDAPDIVDHDGLPTALVLFPCAVSGFMRVSGMEPRHMLLAALVSLCWGGNYVAARIALDAIPPFFLLLLRFMAVAMLLLPFCPRPRVPWQHLALLSFLLAVLHFGLMFFSLWFGLSVSGTIVAGQLGVPFSCLLGSILFNDRLGRWRSLGMLVAFAGVVIIAGTPQITAAFGAFLIACFASLAWGTANIWMKRLGDIPVLPLLAWMALFAIPQFAVLTLMFEHDQWAAAADADMRQWAALSYTVAFSTLLAYGLWYWLLQRFPVSQVTPFNLLVPVFGLTITQWYHAEPLTFQFIAGTALTMLGVAVILIRRPKLGV